VYCVIPQTAQSEFGPIGLGGARVYPIVAAETAALVHDCPAAGYSGDEQVIQQWVVAHDAVVREGWRAAGVVLPMAFHTIVGPTHGRSATENLVGWLHQVQAPLQAKLGELRGKAEFGVQLYWQPQQVMAGIAESSDEIARLRAEVARVGPGAAYLWRQRIRALLRREMESKAQAWSRSCLDMVGRLAARVRVEKVKAGADREMLLNLSVLARQEVAEDIGAELCALQAIPELEVRFTGPWPPYSFAGTDLSGDLHGLLAGGGRTARVGERPASARRGESTGPCAG
jgi:hypothetical protein